MTNTIYLVVEGQTECNFVKDVLKPYFEIKNIELKYHIVKTRNNNNLPANRGGSISIENLLDKELEIVKNPNFLVSTLLDYYGFQNPDNLKINELEKELEKQVKEKYGCNNFIANITKYETETFLYANPEITAKTLDGKIDELLKDLKECNNEAEK